MDQTGICSVRVQDAKLGRCPNAAERVAADTGNGVLQQVFVQIGLQLHHRSTLLCMNGMDEQQYPDHSGAQKREPDFMMWVQVRWFNRAKVIIHKSFTIQR
jgi:hypothetical protein